MLNLLEKIREVSLENKVAFNSGTSQYNKFEELTAPLKEILFGTIEFYYEGKKPFVLKFD